MTAGHCVSMLCENKPSNGSATGRLAQYSTGFGDLQEYAEGMESPLVVKVSPKFRKPVKYLEGEDIIMKVKFPSSSSTKITWRKAGSVHMNENVKYPWGNNMPKLKYPVVKSRTVASRVA